MKLPHSTETERVFLASLIAHPDTIAEYHTHLSEELCHNDIHKIIVNGIINLFVDTRSVDSTRLCAYITNIGLANKDDVDVIDYIQLIYKKSAVRPDRLKDYFRDLYKYHIARKVILACNDTVKEVNQSINDKVSTLVAVAEKNLGKCITAAVEEDYQPIDLYDGIEEEIENLAEDSHNFGIAMPWPTWNRWWGPLTVGDLTVIAAPAKAGKSTILAEIADSAFLLDNKGKNIKVLYLDTELETKRVRSRKVAAAANENEFFIKSGAYKNNPDMKRNVQEKLRELGSKKGVVKHMYVANMPTEKLCSIIRRWAILDTEPGDLRLVIYDYLKLTGEKKDNANLEWQIMGDKCDTIKHLCSEIDAAGVAAIQTNQQQDVAASQRIKWFASNIFLLRKKSPEELSDHGPKFGTHILIPFELRNHGPDWVNDEYVKTAKKEGILYEKNYINLKFHNFAISECGTYGDLCKAERDDIEIEEDKKRLEMEVEELI